MNKRRPTGFMARKLHNNNNNNNNNNNGEEDDLSRVNAGMVPLTAGSRPDPDPTLRTMQLVDKAVANLKVELETRFDAVATRFEGMDKASQLLHDDYVRVPTVVDRAILNLRELILSEIDKTRTVAAERLARVDTVFDSHELAIAAALSAQQKAADDATAMLRSEIDKLGAVSSERFTRIDTQFTERDKRTEQLSLADKTAVAAALQAAKEAVGAQNASNSIAISKSENSTAESIKQLQTLFTTANTSMDEKINDVKSRLDRGEGGAASARDTRQDVRETSKDSRDHLSLIVSVIAVVAAISIPILLRLGGVH